MTPEAISKIETLIEEVANNDVDWWGYKVKSNAPKPKKETPKKKEWWGDVYQNKKKLVKSQKKQNVPVGVA